MSTLVRSLGPALRLMRQRREMKQRRVAELAGITPAMLSAFELRRRLPSVRTLSSILDALDARVLDLGRAVQHVERSR
jgi:transcriptional regulator with XRE-family HTH domain